ncbi:pilus assembly protein [Vogesella sp. LIG4]|uniref:pilus assembly protein n=1 Tax=Vogesella sp. LIG4 TaxID=1192162 RepID=UPI00081F9B70|nr:PilC/PilY family type IV pilus protein [Vogesella sp. LIG4]SCK31034.1 type IV pilus assembly protein PilY1 [Vogesella sp. LIG4]
MKKWLFALVLCMHALLSYADLENQDIDVFMNNPNVASPAAAPNVLIVLDNTANWNTAFSAEKSALINLFGSLSSGAFNVGLMMFTETGSGNGTIDGGYVRYAVQNMTSGTGGTIPQLSGIVNGLDVGNDRSNGGKLSQAIREAYLYFAGNAAYSGVKLKTDPKAFLTNTTNYNSPSTNACQKNFIIYISNGPVSDNTNDNDNSGAYLKLINGNNTPSTIALNPNHYQYDWADEWSRYIHGTDINGNIGGTQNITTYTIDIPSKTSGGNYPDMQALLQSMANVGGGRYIKVVDPTSTSEIQNDLQGVFNEILSVNSVFTSAAVTNSVNNYGTTLNQVYVGMFRTDANDLPRWHGNLKQYQLGLAGNKYVYLDQNGQTVVNSLGQVTDTSTSFWSTSSTFWNATSYPDQQSPGGTSDIPDGSLTIKGGNAEHLRNDYASTDTRKIYTCATCSSGLTQFNTANTTLTGLPYTSFGLTSSSDINNMINWVRGRNVNSDDPSGGSTTGVRGFLHGDVVHSSPLAINYNRSGQPANRDVVVYYGGNDGLLHAVKGGANNADGGELWSFLPQEFYSGLGRLYYNTPILSSSNKKPYFFDGPIGSYLLDADGDRRYDNTGKTDSTKMDKVYIYPTARRGGRLIYAFDVTNPAAAPSYLWSHTSADTGFNELGQTWSPPKVVKIAGYTNPVLIFGAGYDAAAEDSGSARSMGRGIFIVDAFTGALVWKAVSGNVSTDCTTSGSNPTCTKVSGMDYSIPGGIATVDRDLNGYVERLYAGDTGGNVWRVDLGTAKSGSNTVPTFSVNKIATLGGSGTSARKFMYEPDVVFGDTADRVQLGSGDREKPFSLAVQDMFFSIKDPGLTTNAITTPYTLSNLYDATADLVQLGNSSQQTAATSSLASANGWYINLNGALTSRDLGCSLLGGERVSGKSVTLNGVLYFATFMPNYSYTYSGSTGCTATASYNSGSCTPTLGVARIYILNFSNGAPYSDTTDGVAGWALTDRYITAGSGFLGDPTVATQVDSNGNIVDVPLFGLISDPGGFSGGIGTKIRSKVYWYEITD